MGKIKSAIVLTLISLIIAVLCFVCFVPFPVGWVENEGESGNAPFKFFNPIINWTEKSSDFGAYQFGDEASYFGGGYSVVMYPEGVISAKEYRDNGETEDGKEYVAYADGAVYLDKETVCDGGEAPSEEFKEAFAAQLKCLKKRFESLHCEGISIEVKDGYTVSVSLPASLDASIAAFLYFSYMGEPTVLYGTSQDASAANQIIPETGSKQKPASDYIKGASVRNNLGTAYVEVDFTDLGLELLSSATADAAGSSGYLFIQVGGEQVIGLSISEQIHDDLYISGTYTSDSAAIVANTIDTALDLTGVEFGMSCGEVVRLQAGFAGLKIGSFELSALSLVYIVIGLLFVAMSVFFLVRYHALGFAHILTYLLFTVVMVLIFWAIPIPVGLGTILAFVLSSLLLGVSDAVAYEYARKEFALGKTIVSSVKTGYKKSFWHVFDLHIVLLAIALLVYLIALGEFSVFGLALTFGVALSGLGSLGLNRFLWYVTMGLSGNPGKFCHFKREEVEDDE